MSVGGFSWKKSHLIRWLSAWIGAWWL